MVFVGFSSGPGCPAPQRSDKPSPAHRSIGICPVSCRCPGAGTAPEGELALPQGCIAELLDQNTAPSSAKQTLLSWARSRLRAAEVGPEVGNGRTEGQELGEELGTGGGSLWSPGEPRFSSWREFLPLILPLISLIYILSSLREFFSLTGVSLLYLECPPIVSLFLLGHLLL